MKPLRNLLPAVSAALLVTGAQVVTGAQAATITFTDYDYTGASGAATIDGTRITATAATWVRDGFDRHTRTGTGTPDPLGPRHDSAVLDFSSYGLALTNSAHDSNHQIDGLGTLDLVLFEFDELVRLTEATFSFVDWNDDFVLFAGDDLASLSTFSLREVLHGGVALDVVGRAFGIGAFGRNDDFKLTSLSFEDAAPVPLPAAAPLFAGALALGGIARRRRAA